MRGTAKGGVGIEWKRCVDLSCVVGLVNTPRMSRVMMMMVVVGGVLLLWGLRVYSALGGGNEKEGVVGMFWCTKLLHTTQHPWHSQMALYDTCSHCNRNRHHLA